MRPFVENFPFFSIFLAILAAIVTAAIRSGRISYWITIGVCAASALLNGWVLEYTYAEGVSFTYAMGRFLAPYGNAINCGPLQALLAAVFSLVMALALAGGRRDLFQDILPEKQKFYFVMVNMLEASLLALTYTNDMFTGYVFIETSTIAACALVMAKDYIFIGANGLPNYLTGMILLIDLAVGLVVACTVYGFYALFSRGEI